MIFIFSTWRIVTIGTYQLNLTILPTLLINVTSKMIVNFALSLKVNILKKQPKTWQAQGL